MPKIEFNTGAILALGDYSRQCHLALKGGFDAFQTAVDEYLMSITDIAIHDVVRDCQYMQDCLKEAGREMENVANACEKIANWANDNSK